jgi:hypothetical protein
MMKNVITRLVREPNLVLGVVVTGLSLLVLFGVSLTTDQMAGIGVFLGALIALVRYLTTPASEVVAQLKPGNTLPEAGPASTVPDGTPVKVQLL